jgi:hypothetical protein
MKVYISGPITGVKDYDEAFNIRAKMLRRMGYLVANPVEFSIPLEERIRKNYNREPTYQEYMEVCINQLWDCDAISMLENWEASKGARIEHDLAVACGKSIIAVYSGAIRK